MLLAFSNAATSAAASRDVTVFDRAPDGVMADVWSTAEIDPLPNGILLGLERVSLEACSAVALDRAASPVLVVTESSTINVTTV